MKDAHWIAGPGVVNLPTLDLEHPTDPTNYVDRPWAKGTPLYWQHEVTGRLRLAFLAYLSGSPTADELHTVIAYIQHHIHAPCWLETLPLEEGETPDEEFNNEIRALRALSLTLVTAQDVRQYIDRAMDIGLDPL